MSISKYLLYLGLLSFPVFAPAQKADAHPIDISLRRCLKTAIATMPRAKCYSTASEAWQKAVKEDYQKLLTQLSPEMQDILKNEQNAWEKYRQENERFVMAEYGKRKGTGYISVRIIELMKPYKERALELESRLAD